MTYNFYDRKCQSNFGNCEEELPKKPLGHLSIDRFLGEVFFAITQILEDSKRDFQRQAK